MRYVVSCLFVLSSITFSMAALAFTDRSPDELRKNHPELANISLCFLEEPETYYIITGFFSMSSTHAFMGVRFESKAEYDEFLDKKCDATLAPDGKILTVKQSSSDWYPPSTPYNRRSPPGG